MQRLIACLIAAVTLLVIASPADAKRHSRHFHHKQKPYLSHDHILNRAEGDHIVSHPPGCPRTAFCGCGVAVKVFGHPVRNLYLARNWLKFPRAHPAPGMVAARNGHVMYIMAMDANGNAVVYDPNSGGHKTRIHTRSLRGYAVVNPSGASPATVNYQHRARHVTTSL